MRNLLLVNNVLICLFVAGLISLGSCSKNKDSPTPAPNYTKMLINEEGTWNLQGLSYYFQPDGGKKSLYNTDDTPMEFYIIFSDEGSFHLYDESLGDDAIDGTYSVAGKVLSLKMTAGTTDFTILEMDKQYLTLERKQANSLKDGVKGTIYVEMKMNFSPAE